LSAKNIEERTFSNSHYVIASALPWHRPPGQVCEAISSLKHGIASTEERRLAMTLFILRIAEGH